MTKPFGRPSKKGLDWFKLDTKLFDNDHKIGHLLEQRGTVGFTVWLATVSMIYQEGYYIEQPLDDVAMLITKKIGNRWVKKDLVLQVILDCAELDLFDKDLVSRNILTSAGIQKRYDEATVRSKADKSKYWLLKDESQQPYENDVEPLLSAAKSPLSAAKSPLSAAKSPQIRLDKKDIERYTSDDFLPKIAAAFESEFGKLIGGKDRQILIDISSQYDVDLTIEAIRRAKTNGANSAAYIKSMLLRWSEQGITTVQQLNKPKPTKNSKPDYSDPARYSTDKDGDINEIFGSP